MVEYNAISLKAGLPIVTQKPTCAQCHEQSAFIVHPGKGIICGLCYQTNVEEEKVLREIIITEARKKLYDTQMSAL